MTVCSPPGNQGLRFSDTAPDLTEQRASRRRAAISPSSARITKLARSDPSLRARRNRTELVTAATTNLVGDETEYSAWVTRATVTGRPEQD